MPEALKVAAYIRVSSEEQAKEGLSLEAQKNKISQYCKFKDWVLHEVYVDGGYSGSNMNRPAMKKLIVDADNKHFDVVVVYKFDRFSRKLLDLLLTLEKFTEL